MSSAEATTAPAEVELRRALDRVVDPCSIATGVPITLTEMGLVAGLEVSAGRATVHLRVTSPFCMHIGNMQERIIEVLGEVDGMQEVRVEVDDGMEWLPTMMSDEARLRLREVRPLDESGSRG